MQTTEIILRETGVITERTVTERDLDVGPSVVEALTGTVTRSVRNILTIAEWGKVHANSAADDTLWSVPMERIALNTRFRLVNQVLVPVFGSASDVEMPLCWRAPANLRLAFAIRTAPQADCVELLGNWLFAFDDQRRAWRLPLPNLHDDCRICTGDFQSVYPNAVEGIAASLEQFRKSKWNDDLMRTLERAQKFFRFQPTNDTFETLPIEATDWTTLCDKVSTALSERVVL